MTNFETVLNAYQSLPTVVRSLMLSTVNGDGSPHTSYAPYVMDEAHCLYIFTSGLSAHTRNLLATQKAGVMIIEDEAAAQQIFARQRITYDCYVDRLERQSEPWERQAEAFEHRFGDIIQMLRPLGDFQIFRLTPQTGRFIMGFGAAYEVDPDDLSQLVPKPVKPSST
jgi:putative heme iron utilization protein